MTPPDSPQELATIIYRLTVLEQQVSQWHEQLLLYVSIRENDLRIQTMKATAERFESDIAAIKEQLDLVKTAQYNIKESQDKTQIRSLLAVVSVIITIASGVLVAVVTHLIQP